MEETQAEIINPPIEKENKGKSTKNKGSFNFSFKYSDIEFSKRSNNPTFITYANKDEFLISKVSNGFQLKTKTEKSNFSIDPSKHFILIPSL